MSMFDIHTKATLHIILETSWHLCIIQNSSLCAPPFLWEGFLVETLQPSPNESYLAVFARIHFSVTTIKEKKGTKSSHISWRYNRKCGANLECIYNSLEQQEPTQWFYFKCSFLPVANITANHLFISLMNFLACRLKCFSSVAFVGLSSAPDLYWSLIKVFFFIAVLQ